MDICSCCKRELDMSWFYEIDIDHSSITQKAYICPGGFLICYDCHEIIDSEDAYAYENSCKSCIRDRKIGEILNEPLGM